MYITFKNGIATIREKIGKEFSRIASDKGATFVDDEGVLTTPQDVAKYFRKHAGYAYGVADAIRAADKELQRLVTPADDLAKELYQLCLNRSTIDANKIVSAVDSWYLKTRGTSRRGPGRPRAYEYPPEDLG